MLVVSASQPTLGLNKLKLIITSYEKKENRFFMEQTLSSIYRLVLFLNSLTFTDDSQNNCSLVSASFDDWRLEAKPEERQRQTRQLLNRLVWTFKKMLLVVSSFQPEKPERTLNVHRHLESPIFISFFLFFFSPQPRQSLFIDHNFYWAYFCFLFKIHFSWLVKLFSGILFEKLLLFALEPLLVIERFDLIFSMELTKLKLFINEKLFQIGFSLSSIFHVFHCWFSNFLRPTVQTF